MSWIAIKGCNLKAPANTTDTIINTQQIFAVTSPVAEEEIFVFSITSNGGSILKFGYKDQESAVKEYRKISLCTAGTHF